MHVSLLYATPPLPGSDPHWVYEDPSGLADGEPLRIRRLAGGRRRPSPLAPSPGVIRTI
jgi:hypothetical protein